MRILGVTAIVLGLTLAAGIAPAQTLAVTGVTYQRPGADWRDSAIDNGTLYQWDFQNPSNGRPGAAILVVTGTPGFSGDIDGALVQLLDTTGLLIGASPTQSHSGTTTDGLPMVWAMRAGSVGSNPAVEAVTAVVAMQRPEGLASAIMILVNVDEIRRATAEAAFDALVGSIHMGAPRPSLPAPATGSRSLDGLYIYTITSFAPNPMGGTSMRYDWKLRQFDPRGLFADRPVLAGETLDANCAGEPDRCGTYRIDGDQVTLSEVSRFGLVEHTTKDLTPTERGFKIGGTPHEPAQPIGATTLNGSWRFNYFAGGPGGSVTVIRQIDFTADGRYTRTGFAGATVNDPVSGTSGTSSGTDPEHMGRYTIDGLTLTLDSDSGETERVSLVATNPSDLAFVFIDGDLYARVEP